MTLLGSYSAVLSPPGAVMSLTASVVGRLSLGMTGLAALLLVRDSTGSYAAAGAVTAAYALAFAVTAPARARSADRRGPRRVLLQTGVLHPLALGSLVALTAAGAPLLVVALAAMAGGATVPPHGAVMRALWGTFVSGRDLTTAYALESVVVELCFVIGPVLVAVLTAVEGPSSALLVSASLGSVGALWLAVVPAVRAVVPHPERVASFLGPLTSPVVRSLLVTVIGIGAGFGAVEVAVPAFIEEQGARPGLAGVLLAVWALGSAIGGLAYGALHPTSPATRQLPVLVGALAVGSMLPALSTGVLVLAVALFLYGSTIAPFSACNSVLLGGSAPAGTVTEAFAWNGSMIFGGAAIGSALAGVLVEASGATAAMAVAGVAGLLSLVGSFWALRVRARETA